MEAATGVANGRVGSLPISSSSSSSSSNKRKEWRAISDNPPRTSSNEDLDRLKLGQSDERTIYEHGTDVNYHSITVDGGLDNNNDLMQQRLHDVSSQREKMQQMEIELRAQIISRSEIIAMQNSFTDQINEQINAATQLKDHLQEREHAIHELELNLEEKDRELRAIKIDNEAAWAKEDLIREQNKELLAYRRERDNYEAERAQQLQQIHDLQEHIQEKERQYLELEEQHRVLQENILYKDEQLREAQAWIARVDAMQSTTHISLQTELRERTEQFNHFWLGCQRQFADMERHHLQSIQQLQLELADARQRSAVYTEDASADHSNSEEASSFGQTKGTQFNANSAGTSSGNPGILANGNVDEYPSFAAMGNASTKAEHSPGVPIPPSVIGLGAYMQPGQVAALHPFFIPQQGIPHSIPPASTHVPDPHMGHFIPVPAISSHQDWQHQQAVADSSQISNNNQYQPPQTEQNMQSSHVHYDYQQITPAHMGPSGYVVTNAVPNPEVASVITVAREEAQNMAYPQPQQQQESPKFHEELRLDSSDRKVEMKLQDNLTANEGQGLPTEKQHSAETSSLSSTSATSESNGSSAILPPPTIPSGRAPNVVSPVKIVEPRLLDERSLLACIVRAIPAGSGGRVRISSTLPNRLGKMLAPLHWHDYKKRYGKLDDFVAGHPELFVIEEDFIQLREGAQEMISASAAIAKVSAAAAASAPYSSTILPSVAVTPMAQSHHQRPKKVPSDDKSSASQNQNNGVYNNIVQGLSNVKILSNPRQQQQQQNGVQLKGTSNGRPGVNFGGKQQQQGRDSGPAVIPRR
ncbi:hypothetical protein ACHQM5_000028 [Ranunculus cassubicifolius]